MGFFDGFFRVQDKKVFTRQVNNFDARILHLRSDCDILFVVICVAFIKRGIVPRNYVKEIVCRISRIIHKLNFIKRSISVYDCLSRFGKRCVSNFAFGRFTGIRLESLRNLTDRTHVIVLIERRVNRNRFVVYGDFYVPATSEQSSVVFFIQLLHCSAIYDEPIGIYFRISRRKFDNIYVRREIFQVRFLTSSKIIISNNQRTVRNASFANISFQRIQIRFF